MCVLIISQHMYVGVDNFAVAGISPQIFTGRDFAAT